MTDQTKLIEQFYAAFARRDGDAMAACYADDVRFSDPVFPKLEGEHAGAMWRMLCTQGKDLTIDASDIAWDGTRGRAKWVARYTFTATGRKVENIVHATFAIANAKIVEHTDLFDFGRWSRQALGLPGFLLGWSSFLQRKVQQQAAKALASYEAKKSDG